MKTFLALGNPGPRYRDTRHNVGWWLADRLCVSWSLPPYEVEGPAAATGGLVNSETVRVLKPLTYVNRSGRVIEHLRDVGDLRVDDLLVLVDDVSLPPGSFRIRAQGSAGGHNGLASLEQALGTRGYARLRIGVGRPPDSRIDLTDWVLAPPGGTEEETILLAFPEMQEAVQCWMMEGIDLAMSRFNRSVEPAGTE